ncbi:hypothetical protein JYT74_00750 [Crocinitomix catalasitica]|nr:hypothetical protein [Crocinitomix catalasitica]
MKQKFVLILSIGAVPLLFSSCGGDGDGDSTDGNDSTTVEESGPIYEEECTADNDIFYQIENYGYQFDSTFTHNGIIDVTRSEWTVKNDSTAELRLYNFDLGAADTATNIQIYVEFHSKNGEVLQPGIYAYHDYESNLWSKVNIISPLGTVWFNWSMGMPKQGHVELNYFDDDNACGEFSLEVNKPDASTIGKVILKGAWKSS